MVYIFAFLACVPFTVSIIRIMIEEDRLGKETDQWLADYYKKHPKAAPGGSTSTPSA